MTDLAFADLPNTHIERVAEKTTLVEDLDSINPSSPAFFLSGIKGTGKTTLLREVSKDLEDRGWVVLNLPTTSLLLHTFGSRLVKRLELDALFSENNINTSIFSNTSSSFSSVQVDVTLKNMLQVLHSTGKKVLILLDNVVKTDDLKAFISEFQLWVGENLPVFLLMTGTPEDISALQDDPSLTFLYRAPNISLSPLNVTQIARTYQEVFNLDKSEALEKAMMTKGYPFAYSLLGTLLQKNQNLLEDPGFTSFDLDFYLQEFVYKDLWGSLSKTDRQVLFAFLEAPTEDVDVSFLQETLDFPYNKFSVYRKRLMRKGILVSPCRGQLSFALPRFSTFVLSQRLLSEVS